MSSDVANVYVGAQANDGTGDAIRTAFQTVNSNFYNLDNRISVGNIAVIYATVGLTGQTIVSNSSSQTQTLEVYQTANVAGNVQIGNLSVNNAFTATTITSTGNTNVQNGLVVTGTGHFKNDVTVIGNLVVLGNTATVSSQDLAIQDSIIQLHTPSDLSPLTYDDGKDVGIAFHYYKTSDKSAALVWANDTQALEFYADGSETIANVWSGTYGNVKIGSLFTVNTTAATSSTTGAIVSRGGIGAAGNIWVGGNLNVVGNTFIQTANVKQLSVSEKIVGSLYLSGGDTIYINGSPVATSASSFSGGNVPNYTLFQSVVEARGNIYANSQVTSISTTTGALVVNGGAGISGNLNVGGAFSVGSINNTVIGNITPATGGFTTLTATGNIVAASTTESVGVTTGALVVKGGVGIAGNLWIGGSLNNASIGVYGAGVGNFTTIGATTAGTGTFTVLRANSTAASTSTSTGALVVLGGAGISGNINAGAIYSDVIRFANGSPYGSTIIANTAEITANVSSGADVGLSLTTSGVTADTYGNVTYHPSFNVDSKGRITTASNIATYIGLAGTTGTGTVNNQGTLTFAGTNGTSISVSGSTATIGVATTANVTVGNLLPSANAVSNIGDASHWFGTIYGVSSQAKYADLAENYVSDGTCGTAQVVIFGGEAEITICTEFADTRVAGVISTNPAYLMNADCYQGQPVALRGRVPVSVVGKVSKGDLLVTSTTPGCAISVGNDKKYGPAVFAKSLNDKDDDGVGQIEAVIL